MAYHTCADCRYHVSLGTGDCYCDNPHLGASYTTMLHCGKAMAALRLTGAPEPCSYWRAKGDKSDAAPSI